MRLSEVHPFDQTSGLNVEKRKVFEISGIFEN